MGTRALAGLVLVAALVAGCTVDPEPKIADPTPSASSSAASPSPTVSEAADPEQAYRDFIDGYVAAISESLSTGDPVNWLEMSDPACTGCSGLANKLRAAYANGGRIEGGAWTVDAAKEVDLLEDGAVWLVTVKSAEETWVGADGEIAQVVDAGSTKFVFTIGAGPAEPMMREVEVQTA